MTAPPTTPVAASDVTTTTLRDGARVQVRAMQPADAARLVRFHLSLSPETTRWRWFSYHPMLTPTELHRLTHVDHHDREAIVALDGDEIVGVARWDRAPVTDRAEVAFVVTDEWQGRGVGRMLFHELATRARVEGIGMLTAQMLGDNRRMLAVFRHGNPATTSRYRRDGTVEVEIPLDEGEPARFVVETTDHRPGLIAEARHALDAWLHRHGVVGERCDAAVLVGDELFTNALRNTFGLVRLVVDIDVDRVRIAVFDESLRLPSPLLAMPGDGRPHGLAIIEATADEWGSEHTTFDGHAGKVVWATCTAH